MIISVFELLGYFSLELRLDAQIIPARGVVRRSLLGEGMGIQFIEISAAARKQSEKYLDSQAAPAGEAGEKQ
jgi:hypothetical protein